MNNIRTLENISKKISNNPEMDALANALISIMIEYSQEYSEFHSRLCKFYVQKLYEDFNGNISKIRATTGFTKNFIKNNLTGKLKEVTDFIDKQRQLLVNSYNEINRYCYTYKVKKMPKLNFLKTMQAYHDGHISLNARIEHLCKTGFLGFDENYVFIDLDGGNIKKTNSDYLKLITDATNSLVDVVNYNKNRIEEMIPLFQRRVSTTKIPPELAQQVAKEINSLLTEHCKQIGELLTRYEKDVPVDTFPVMSVYYLHYNKTLINLQEEKNDENHKN